MATGIELFHWQAPEAGFEWRESTVMSPENQKPLTELDLRETRFLVPRPMETPRHRRYKPLDHPTLYREFGAIEATAEAFAEFASSYGDLGIGVFIEGFGFSSVHDPFCRWEAAHARMHPVVEVLNAIQAEDATALGKWFTLTANGARYHRGTATSGSFGWVTIKGEMREYLWRWAAEADSDAESLLRIARGWAQNEINEAMSGDKQIGTRSSARVVFDVDREQMTVRIVPDTLIGAMWFQCARVLALNPTFRSCKHCSKWFELSPDTRRKQAIYCTDRCKVAAYRAKVAATRRKFPGAATP